MIREDPARLMEGRVHHCTCIPTTTVHVYIIDPDRSKQI
jgi:hypothetical protein